MLPLTLMPVQGWVLGVICGRKRKLEAYVYGVNRNRMVKELAVSSDSNSTTPSITNALAKGL